MADHCSPARLRTRQGFPHGISLAACVTESRKTANSGDISQGTQGFTVVGCRHVVDLFKSMNLSLFFSVRNKSSIAKAAKLNENAPNGTLLMRRKSICITSRGNGDWSILHYIKDMESGSVASSLGFISEHGINILEFFRAVNPSRFPHMTIASKQNPL